MTPVVGNELLMLKLLQEQPRQFGELVEKTKLSNRVVSKHLKNLQKRGHVIRNAERKYMALKPEVKDSDIAAFNPNKPADVMAAQTTWLYDALTLTTNKEIQLWLQACFVKGTFHSILSNIARTLNDAFETRDLLKAHMMTKHFSDEYLAPALQLLVMDTIELTEIMAELAGGESSTAKHAWKRLLREDPEIVSFLKRPFAKFESDFYKVAASALLTFAQAYRKLRTKGKKESSELSVEELFS